MKLKSKTILLSLCLSIAACEAETTLKPTATGIPGQTPATSQSATQTASQSASVAPTAEPSVAPTPAPTLTPTPVPIPMPSPSTTIAPKAYTTIYTIAGTGQEGDPDTDLQASKISFRDVFALTLDSKKNLYVSINNKILRISDEIKIVDATPYRNVSEWVTDVSQPQGLAVDSHDNLYISDTLNHRILKVTTDKKMSVIAGSLSSPGFTGDGSPAINALLNQPAGICFDKAGNLYIADRGNHKIRKIDASTEKISTVAGGAEIGTIISHSYPKSSLPLNPTPSPIEVITEGTLAGFSGDGGAAVNAKLDSPVSVAVDANNNVYLVDANNRIRKIDDKGIITTIAGTGSKGYNSDMADKPATTVHLNLPQALFVSPLDKLLYITDTKNNCIRRINPDGGINTIAGNLRADDGIGDYSPPLNGSIAQPNVLTIDKDGIIYLYDSGHKRIRVLK